MDQIHINSESLLKIAGTLFLIFLLLFYRSTRTSSYKQFSKLPYILLSAWSSLPLPIYCQFESLKNGERIVQKIYQEQLNNNEPYALYGMFVSNPVVGTLVRRKLAAHLDVVAHQMTEEVELAPTDLVGTDSERYKEVNVNYIVSRIAARAANRICVGPELCRNNNFIEHCIQFNSSLATASSLMGVFPVWLKPVVGSILTLPVCIAYRQCSSYLVPKFANLVSHSGSGTDAIETGLLSSWLVSNLTKSFPPSSRERAPDYLSRRTMMGNFVAIHSTTMTTCNLLLDIFSNPDAAALLRDELVNLNIATEKDTGTKSRDHAQLKSLRRLDSTLRESMRLWSIVPRSLQRKVVHPDGVTLPGGQHVSQGVRVCIYAWGMGKHACPGRFFAVDLVKIIVGKMLLGYEIEMLGERPDNVWVEYNVIPPPSATLSIRRRKALPVI